MPTPSKSVLISPPRAIAARPASGASSSGRQARARHRFPRQLVQVPLVGRHGAIVDFMSVDLFSEDLDKYDNKGKYSALEEFCAARLNEGWRLDYAENWDDRALEKVAAFANTFGGVLIIGVKKDKRDVEPLLVGVNSTAEYKTRIASSIAANISPVPSYHVYECHKPEEPNSKFCVVQVRNVDAFHLLTKKNIKPIHIRNEDETREADAADIRRLLERSRTTQDIPANLRQRADETLRSLRVRSDRKMLDPGRESFAQSQSLLKMILIPIEFRGLDLEKSHEDRLKRLIRDCYPSVSKIDSEAASWLTEDRGSSYFEWIWYHTVIDWEMRWHISAEGQIAHATQIRSKNTGAVHQWSVLDLCDFLFLFLNLSSRWWEERGYFGDGVIFVDLTTDNLPIFRDSQGAFGRLLNPRAGHRELGCIASDAIQLSVTGRSRAEASQRFSPALMRQSAIPTVISLSNALLRSLGHLVDGQSLDRSLRSMYPPTA